MKITLKKLRIENMRSTKARTIEFRKDRTVLKGENGTGKTTEADGWNWLINFKDSSGRSAGDIRPIHRSGPNKDERIRGLIMAAEAVLGIEEADDPDMNGDWTLRKEESESGREVIKHGVPTMEYAYNKKYWINGDPTLENKFQAWLANIHEDADVLRALTDVHFFLADEKKGGIHHTKRRKMVRAIAGDIGKPPDFDDIETAIKGRTLEGYKKELTDANAGYNEEVTDTESRIKEKTRDIQAYVPSESEPELIRNRDLTVETIAEIEAERKKVLSEQTQYQKDYLALTKLNGEKIIREAELKVDTSGTEKLRAEVEALRQADAEWRTRAATCAGTLRLLKISQQSAKDELNAKMARREKVRTEFTGAKEKSVDSICYACGQDLPADKVDVLEDRRQKQLNAIRERGYAVQAEIRVLEKTIGQRSSQITEQDEARLEVQADLLKSEEITKKRLAEIAEEIRACPGLKPEEDAEWNDLYAKIKSATLALGPPVADVLEELEARKSGAEAMRDKYNKALNAADTVAKDKKRLAELEALQKELAQKIVTNNGKVHRIREYVRAESQLITDAVNGRFNVLEFRLFKLRKNGEVQECCDAMVKGVPYAELSAGETISAHVDGATVLGTYYDIRVPLFVDECEQLTPTIEAPTQVIELHHDRDVNELVVEVG